MPPRQTLARSPHCRIHATAGILTHMLTERRKRFVEAYVANPNATQAAREAGYGVTDRSIEVQGSRLLSNVEVQQAIAERAADAAIANELTPEWVVSRFMQHADQQENGPLAVSALRELARVQQMYNDHVTVTDVRTRAVQLAEQHGVDADELETLVAELTEGKAD